MTVRGTRHLFGKDADQFNKITEILKSTVEAYEYVSFYPSLLAEQDLFKDNVNQIYAFKDKGNRNICLIPEVTAVVRKLYKDSWSKSLPKPIRLYYLTKCFRYDRPQLGRYREFWQFGIEVLGAEETHEAEVSTVLEHCLQNIRLKNYKWKLAVKRGLGYYIKDGFEIEIPSLGAQKQIAGGGRYDCGIGWAIGIDRLLLAIDEQNKTKS